MADAVVAAIITGSVALVGSISALGWKVWSWRKEREQLEIEAEQDVETATASTDYPYTVDTVVVKVAILNENGDSVTDSKVIGLRVREGTTINSLPGDFTTTGEFNRSEPPTLLETSRDAVTFDGDLVSAQKYVYRLKVVGGLADDDAPLDYCYRVSAKGGYLLKQDAIKARYATDPLPCDFFHHTVTVPVKRLEISVKFPSSVELRTFPLVTYGDSPRVPKDERRRVDAAFSSTSTAATLSVDDPKPGYRYLICWDGSSRAAKSSL